MRFWLACLLCLLAAGTRAAITVTDDASRPVTLAAPARRIVSLSPHITDMLLALGARAQIAGVVDDHESPGAYSQSLTGLPVVAGPGSVNEERLLTLKPDLVLVWRSGLAQSRAQRLEALGLAVAYIEPATLEGIPADIKMLGLLSGHAEAARQQAQGLRQQLVGLRQRYAAGRRLRAFFEVWRQPLYTLQGRHLVSQALALCGADNIMPAGTVAAPEVNLEYVLRADPDVIFFAAEGAAGSQAFWNRFSGLRAVKEGHLVPMPGNALSRPGPDLINALPQLCTRLASWRQ